MLTMLLTALAIALIVGGLVAFASNRVSSAGTAGAYLRNELRQMPSELATADLLHSEKQLYATLGGSSIPVRPDQVYRTLNREVVPVDTKTRRMAKIFEADIIELSVQSLALAESHVHAGRGAVARHGYIRFKDREGRRAPKYVRAALWGRERLEALYLRYLGIVDGTIAPVPQSNPRACAGCAYRSRCPTAR